MGIISQDCSADRHGSLYDSRLKVVLFPEGSLVNKEVMGMLLSSMKKFLLMYSQKLIFFSLITCRATLQQNYQSSLTA